MIHLYYGENSYAVSEKADAVIRAFRKKYGREAVARIDGREVDPKALEREMTNLDLFASRKLLVISGAATKPTTWERIATAATRVPETTEIVLIEGKIDGRLAATKTLKKLADAKEFMILKPYELERWAEAEGEKFDLTFSGDARTKLISFCHCDQWRIHSEMKKLAAVTRKITPEIVEKYVEPDLAADAFGILELAVSREREDLTCELEKLRTSEAAEKFFGLLGTQVFALAAAVFSGGRTSVEVAKALAIHPFVMKKSFELARATDTASVRQLVRRLADVDAKIKLGADGWTLIDVALKTH